MSTMTVHLTWNPRVNPEDIDWSRYRELNGADHRLPGLAGDGTFDQVVVNTDRLVLPERTGRPPRRGHVQSSDTRRRIAEGIRRAWRRKKSGAGAQA